MMMTLVDVCSREFPFEERDSKTEQVNMAVTVYLMGLIEIERTSVEEKEEEY